MSDEKRLNDEVRSVWDRTCCLLGRTHGSWSDVAAKLESDPLVERLLQLEPGERNLSRSRAGTESSLAV